MTDETTTKERTPAASVLGADPRATVCTLPPEELRARVAMIRREILPRATRAEELPDGMAWEFPRDAATEATLAGLVEFERQCCTGLSWSVGPAGRSGLRLVVEGADPRSGVFEAFRVPAIGDTAVPGPERSRLALAAKAGGIGVVLSLVLCCALPIGVAAVAGAAVAAPLARLDQPLPIALAAAAIALPAWWVMARRARARCGDAC